LHGSVQQSDCDGHNPSDRDFLEKRLVHKRYLLATNLTERDSADDEITLLADSCDRAKNCLLFRGAIGNSIAPR
jgi:hypothetical protein